MKALSACLILGLVTTSPVFANALVDVTWKEPENYRDIRPANETREGFKTRTFEQLEKYFSKLAERLDDGTKLSIEVTNLDLAGQVWPASFVGIGSGASDVRLIKSVDIPRMSFSYSYADANGEVIKSDTVDLKDMAFQDRANPLFTNDALRYEKNMLRQWFDDTFPKEDVLAKAEQKTESSL